MKKIVAFAAWNERIAPVFDVSENLVLLEIENGRIVRETKRAIAGEHPEEKMRALLETGAEALVCGAISRYLHDRIAAAGIEVVPFIAGDLAAIIPAWARGNLDPAAFAMPGCWAGRRRGWRCGIGGDQEVNPLMRGRRQGQGAGMGRGRGQGSGGGMGRGGGPRAAGPGGACVCPKCGHTEPHEVGVRCIDRTCPKCGSVMTRG